MAFNTVDYELLACRLAAVGIQGSALKWLTSFLQDWNQTVMIGEEKSRQHPLQCGVPQGAILSPMLFNVYMRPLAQLVRGFGLGCHQYTDDTQLYLLMDDRSDTPPNCSDQMPRSCDKLAPPELPETEPSKD